MGKRGQWSRWGRGMCEGWSLELGNAFRGAVVRQDHFEQPATWLASVNAAYQYPRTISSSCVLAITKVRLPELRPSGKHLRF